MDKCERIARRIVSAQTMKIRDFLKTDYVAEVVDEQRTWSCMFEGKKELTADGMARWSAGGTLDLPITLNGDVAVVSGLKTDEQEKAVCSLFNTLAGNVNEDTYNKYVKQ